MESKIERKLKALLEGLQTQDIDKLMNGDESHFKAYGEVYFNAIKHKVNSETESAFEAAREIKSSKEKGVMWEFKFEDFQDYTKNK